MIKIDLITGFLGAGKTTFIQNLLKQTLQNEKIVIIGNDFGEINFDASLLSQCGYKVKALNSINILIINNTKLTLRGLLW